MDQLLRRLLNAFKNAAGHHGQHSTAVAGPLLGNGDIQRDTQNVGDHLPPQGRLAAAAANHGARDGNAQRTGRKFYDEGADFLRNTADPVYYPVAKALRHMSGELEKLRGFVRFSDYNGVLGSEIEPKNQVLPLLRRHFCDRYANEAFFLYDRTHRELLVYAKGHSRILPMDSLQLALPGDEEVSFRRLWKRFYETIAIKERYNPRCQNTFMPKRYRGTMTEFLPDDYEARQQGLNPPAASGAFPGPGAPDGRSAPGIPLRSGPSAPGSGI